MFTFCIFKTAPAMHKCQEGFGNSTEKGSRIAKICKRSPDSLGWDFLRVRSAKHPARSKGRATRSEAQA
jgi:hypothetical protein